MDVGRPTTVLDTVAVSEPGVSSSYFLAVGIGKNQKY